MTLKQIQTEPTVEPLTLTEVKAHLVIDHDDDDAMLVALIKAARKHFEMRTNRVVVRQKWRLFFDYYMGTVDLEPYQVQEVSAVQYLDADGATQTLSSSIYTVDVPRQKLYLAYGQTWPSIRYVTNAWWVDVWAGYYTVASPLDLMGGIPQDAKHAMLMMVGDLYENRETRLDVQNYANPTYDALIAPHVWLHARW